MHALQHHSNTYFSYAQLCMHYSITAIHTSVMPNYACITASQQYTPTAQTSPGTRSSEDTSLHLPHLISHHIRSCHIISYHIISYHIISYHRSHHIILWFHILHECKQAHIQYNITRHHTPQDMYALWLLLHFIQFLVIAQSLLRKRWSESYAW